MYAVTVSFNLEKGRREDFLPLMVENARQSLLEPACRQFDVCSDPEQPDTVFLYEIYDDLAGFETHLDTAHFKDFGSKSSEMVTSKILRCFAEVIQ